MPALSSVASQLTPARLRSIIDHGLGESKNPTKPYMPVWGDVISKQQVSDLIAYLRAGLPAVPTAAPPAIPQGVLGRAPIVSMPHWGGIISNDQLNALVAYLKTLK